MSKRATLKTVTILATLMLMLAQAACGCPMNLSPCNCSVKMSPYEREECDIDSKGTETAEGDS
jgi:hypothetical protein